MSRPVRIILWQLWRLKRLESALWLLAQLTVAVVFLIEAQSLEIDSRISVTRTLVMLMFWGLLTWELSASWRFTTSGPIPFPLYLGYVQPVKTGLLVFLCMAYTAAKVAVAYLAVALLMNMSLDRSLPLLPFAFLLTVMAMFVQAAAWSSAAVPRHINAFTFGAYAVFGVLSLVSPLGGGGVDREAVLPDAINGLFEFSAAGYFGLALATLGAYAIAWAGVERQRHGESLFPHLRRRPIPGTWRRLRVARHFSGPIQVQIWCEIRRAFLLRTALLQLMLPAIIVFLPTLAFPPDEVTLVFRPDEAILMIRFWLLIICLAVLYQLSVGGVASYAFQVRGGGLSYSTFEATLPIGTGKLSLIKVAAVAAGGIQAFILAAVGTAIGLYVLLLEDEWVRLLGEGWQKLTESPDSPSILMWIACLYVLSLWAVSLPSLLFSFSWAMRAALSRPSCLFVFLCILSPCLVNAWGLAALTVGGAVWAVFRSLQRGYLDKRLFVACFVLWAISVGIWFMAAPQTKVPLFPTNTALGIALLFMPLLAVAWPPLALAAHRHR